MKKVFGIDVSAWQGDFDFKKAIDQGVKFVILRGAYGKTKDKRFEGYYKEARRLGLQIGCYHYSMATDVKSGREEAEFLYNNCLKGKRFELPIYIDVEDKIQRALSKRKLTDIVKAYCNVLESRKCFVGIYSYNSFFKDQLYDGELQGYAHWVAHWSTKCDYTKDSLGMWQFGGEINKLRTNKVAGVVCDQNYMLKDYPKIVKEAGKNGFGTPYKTLHKMAVRSQPYSNSTLIGYAKKGAIVNVDSINERGWGKVFFNGKTGYIRVNYNASYCIKIKA